MRYLAGFLLSIMCSFASAQAPDVVGTGTGDLAKSHVFAAEQGNVRTMANGGQSRDIVHAALATGESVSIHESVQMIGAKPNPAHTIQHSEFILVREGTLAYEHDGLTEKAGPGSILYVAYGTLHSVRNVGDTAAKYVVIAIGGDQKR
jgi:quercetin dioxygenase-like cupin family protein